MNYKFNLPPLPEQKAIAQILGVLDEKIELNRQMNETLEAMARALFKSWFVDFDPVHAKAAGQQPAGLAPEIADLFPSTFTASPLGPIPAGWEVKPLSAFGNIITGKTPSTKNPDFYGQEIPFITIPDMHNTIFVINASKKLSTVGADSQKNKYLSTGSIMVSCIATPGLVVMAHEECQTNQQINSLVPHNKDESVFLFFALKNIASEIGVAGSGGSVFQNMNKSQFSNLKILTPPTSLGLEFSKISNQLLARILFNEKHSENLIQLRDTLLPKLISGQLRVQGFEQGQEHA